MQQSTANRTRNLAIYPGKMPSIEYAYFKVTTMFANIGLKKRHMRVSSSSIDFLSKVKQPIPSQLTQLVRPSILRNNITFYVHIFKNANALHTIGRANLMQSCKHYVNLVCSYLFIDYNYCLRLVSKHNWFPVTDAPERQAFPHFKTQDGHSSSWTVYMILKCKSISWSRAL